MMKLRHKQVELPPKWTEAEMDAILAEPIWETVQRGENVALEPYAKPLFNFMASFCPKQPIKPLPPLPQRPAARITPYEGGHAGVYTGASAAYSSVCASVASCG